MDALKLIDYLKQQGAVKAAIINNGAGDFVSAEKAGFKSKEETPELRFTLPIGGRSQGGRIAEMNVIITEDKQDPTKKVAIATMNQVKVLDEVSLV